MTYENNENNNVVSNSDLQHHHMAKKYADAYIKDRLQYISSGESSHDIRNNLMGYYRLHNEERMIKNVIRNITLDPKVERSYEGNSLADVHVRVKEEYRNKDIPNYY